MPLVADHPNVIVTRSFSKGYSLAGIRLGYLVGQAEIVAELIKVKDSYNCDMLSQVAGIAALRDQDYLLETRSKILATRARLTKALRALGYTVPDSQSNFVWATGGPPARETFQSLKDHKILVRLMSYPGYPDGLRVTVGTDAQIDRLLEHVGQSATDRTQPIGASSFIATRSAIAIEFVRIASQWQNGTSKNIVEQEVDREDREDCVGSIVANQEKRRQTESAAFKGTGTKDGPTHQEFPLASRSAIPEANMTTRSKILGMVLSAHIGISWD